MTPTAPSTLAAAHALFSLSLRPFIQHFFRVGSPNLTRSASKTTHVVVSSRASRPPPPPVVNVPWRLRFASHRPSFARALVSAAVVARLAPSIASKAAPRTRQYAVVVPVRRCGEIRASFRGARLRRPPFSSLRAASGNLGLVTYALDQGQPVNSVLDGVLSLHVACLGGHHLVVGLLIECSADVNEPPAPTFACITRADTELLFCWRTYYRRASGGGQRENEYGGLDRPLVEDVHVPRAETARPSCIFRTLGELQKKVRTGKRGGCHLVEAGRREVTGDEVRGELDRIQDTTQKSCVVV